MDEIILNDRYWNVFGSVCSKCKHFNDYDFKCPAFPQGIWDKILNGPDKHYSPVRGQKGKTVFEKRSDLP